MRSARYAGLVAGAVCLQGMAWAGEGSALRGLKPPPAVESYALSGSQPGLKREPTAVAPNLSPRLFLSSGSYTSSQASTRTTDLRFTLYQPVGQNVAALAEPGLAGLGNAVPRQTLQTQITRSLPGGWGLGLGVRETQYNYSSANLLSFSAERSFGSFRGAYTLFSNKADGATVGSAQRFEVSYLYGQRNTIGLSYTSGREVDQTGFTPAAALSDVRDWTLSGRHWLSPNWALTYDVLSQEQPLYRRQGLRLGVSRSF